ncbi:serine/threonine-protein kinase pelle-like [Leptinotarsa decemlineata]|uniref:serine/threonine-protein kinase pelle-like n=1 Tax=Leptinotarsa decemlineata TaxID=7539 RepID=UPI003D30702A
MNQNTCKEVFIYKLPYDIMTKLIHIFDRNKEWERLGFFMKYNKDQLDKIETNGESPTWKLLNMWGDHNHTVLELFILLYLMKHYEGMNVIKSLIDEQYHHHIKSPTEQLDDENDQTVLPEPQVCIEKSVKVDSTDISSVIESAGSTPSIPYEELGEATDNWSEENLLGKGGFGKVFKGTWKCTKVAIKRLENKENKPKIELVQIKQSITELHCLNSYRHDNVLPLYGYSVGGSHPCLIYQYMAGGALDNRLRVKDNDKALTWPARLNIAIGTARGLQFLHTIKSTPLIHGDIKCANILLDANDNPRIGDFGLAREGSQCAPNYLKVSRVFGTKPYLPKDFITSKELSTKVDTYSFGVVLFEIGTSLEPYSIRRKNKFLRDHVLNYEGDLLALKDQRAKGYNQCYKGIMEIGKMCVRTEAKDRPEMTDVLKLLEKLPLSD